MKTKTIVLLINSISIALLFYLLFSLPKNNLCCDKHNAWLSEIDSNLKIQGAKASSIESTVEKQQDRLYTIETEQERLINTVINMSYRIPVKWREK